MKNIKLKSIKIENFKGIKNAELSFDDKKTILEAPNHSGKTSIRNAFEWCLNQTVNDYAPKLNNQELCNLTTRVALNMQIDDIDYTFERVSYGKYEKNEDTGAIKKVSNTSKYFIDGIELSQANYNNQIVGIFNVIGLEQLPILVNKDYFAEGGTKFDWRERRKLLLKMAKVGTIVNELKQQDKFAEIRPQLDKGFPISDIKQSLEKEKKAYKTAQERNLVLIEQKELETNELKQIDFDALEQKAEQLENQLAELRTKTLEEIGADNLKNIGNQIVENTKRAEKLKSDDAIRLSAMKKQLIDLYNTAKTTKVSIDKENANLEELKLAQNEIKKHKVDNRCPTCKQELPEDKIEKAQNEIKKQLKDISAQVKDKEKAIKDLCDKYREYKTDYDNLNIEINEFDPNPEIKVIEDTIKELKTQLESEKNEPTRVLSQKAEKDILEQIKFVNTQLAKRELIEKCVAIGNKWKNENIKLADEILIVDRKLNLLDEFTRLEIQTISDNVNDLFAKGITFALFKENYNGSIEYECTPLYNNVRYESLSTGEKLITNVGIQEAIQEYFDINLPIFVDNFECLTIPLKTKRQLICLKVADTPNFELELLKGEE